MFHEKLSTEEWLKIRTLGIGGSDAGIIAGCNPYRSIFELWQEKRGEIPVREEESEVTHFGKVLEDVVRKEFIQRTGLMVRKKNSILRSKEYPFMIADVDGIISELDGTYSIFEAKTAIEFKNNDWKNGEIPKAYQLQVQHYLAVTGFQKAYIAVLVGGNKFYWTEVYRDEQLIKMLVSMESHFWHCVGKRKNQMWMLLRLQAFIWGQNTIMRRSVLLLIWMNRCFQPSKNMSR